MGALSLSACTMSVNLTEMASNTIGNRKLYDMDRPACADIDHVPANLYCEYAAKLPNPKLIGLGTLRDPYKICSPYQWNAIGTDTTMLASFIELTSDIDMSCISGNHNVIGINSADSFTGSFNGNGKKIKNFTYNDPTVDYVGVFGFTNGGSIANVTIENANITGKNWTAIAVGDSEGGHVLNVKVSGVVTGVNNVGGLAGRAEMGAVNQSSSTATVNGVSSVGGLVGSGGTPLIISSYFSGVVNATGNTVGGIIGSNVFGVVQNSYSTGSVTSTGNNVGGIVGSQNSGGITNTYSSGPVSGAISVGGIIGEIQSAGGHITNSFTVSSVEGQGTSAQVGRLLGSVLGTINNSYYWSGASCDADKVTAGVQACNTVATGTHASTTDFQSNALQPMASWDFEGEQAIGTADLWTAQSGSYPVPWYMNPVSVTIPFASGSGTIDDPYVISDVTMWNKIGTNPRWMSAHFKLGTNIDFEFLPFVQIGKRDTPFYGSFDGNSRALQNISFNAGGSYAGVFGIIMHPAEVKDLTISNASITGTTFSGILAAACSGQINRISVQGTLNGGYHTGGVLGIFYKPGIMSDTTSSATIVQSPVTAGAGGGLVGSLSGGTIQRSIASGNLSGANNYGGGLVGAMGSGLITDSISQVNVTGGTYQYIGGLVGRMLGTSKIANSYATGSINGRGWAGGVTGYQAATAFIENVFVTGNVSGTGGVTRVGLFSGEALGSITNSYVLSSAVCDSATAAGIQACNTSYSTGSYASISDFYDIDNEPLASWDFNDTWLENVLALPLLK